MGFLRKIGRKIGKGIKKIGRGIKKGLKGIAKGIGKLGIVGTIAMMFIMPYVPILWTNLGTFASGLTASSSVFARAAGYAMKGIYHAGKVGGKIYSTVSNAITGTLSRIPGVSTISEAVGKTFNNAMDWTRQKLGIADPTAFYSEASLDFKEFQNVAGKNASLKDFEAFKKTEGYARFKSINEQGSEIYNFIQDQNVDVTGSTDTLRKNETLDDFLDRNNMTQDQFADLNPEVKTAGTDLTSSGMKVQNFEVTPSAEYNVAATEQDIIRDVRKIRLDGRTAGLELDESTNMYKIKSQADSLIEQGLTPDEAYLRLNDQYQEQFQGLGYKNEGFKGYARSPVDGSYYKQDQDLLNQGMQGLDAVSDMTIVTPESDPNFFQRIASKVVGEDSIDNMAVKSVQNEMTNQIGKILNPMEQIVTPGWSGGYSGYNKQQVTSNNPLDTGFGGMISSPTIGVGQAQMNTWNAQENLGYGGTTPSYQSSGYFGNY